MGQKCQRLEHSAAHRSLWTEKDGPTVGAMSGEIFFAAAGMGPKARGQVLVAKDGFSARYDLDRVRGVFSRPDHKLAGENYVGRVLVLDAAKGGVATAWMLHEMKSRG